MGVERGLLTGSKLIRRKRSFRSTTDSIKHRIDLAPNRSAVERAHF
jgi:hypothetical protein